MTIAHHLAKRSTCKRLQVGTVITTIDFRKIISIGYNGNAQGFPNTCDRDEKGDCGCLHSEENAAIHCDAPREQKKVVFVTHLPCAQCAKRLINLGSVKKVYYKNSYRDEKSLEMFPRASIEIERYTQPLPYFG